MQTHLERQTGVTRRPLHARLLGKSYTVSTKPSPKCSFLLGSAPGPGQVNQSIHGKTLGALIHPVLLLLPPNGFRSALQGRVCVSFL